MLFTYTINISLVHQGQALKSHKILYWQEIQQKSLFMMQHPHKTNIIVDTFIPTSHHTTPWRSTKSMTP